MADQRKRSFREGILKLLFQLYGPAQLSPTDSRKPVNSSAGIEGTWVIKRRPDGSTYLAPAVDGAEAPRGADGDPEADAGTRRSDG